MEAKCTLRFEECLVFDLRITYTNIPAVGVQMTDGTNDRRSPSCSVLGQWYLPVAVCLFRIAATSLRPREPTTVMRSFDSGINAIDLL